jgi:N-methylhydantoinase A
MSSVTASPYRLAIDVGGTFTDLVLAGAGDRWRTFKTSSTPADPSDAVVTGLGLVAAEVGIGPAELLSRTPVIVHGMTITTNALLTRSGSSTALLTTRGFRDIVGLRQGHREAQFDSRTPPPPPLVPRRLVFGIGGRIDRHGRERSELVEQDVRDSAATLRRQGVESVAIALMFSFLDPSHERRVAEILAQELPGASITVSSEVSPEIRFYERSSTAVVNAYVSPVLRRYLTRLSHRLGELGFTGTLLIMQSDGGVGTTDTVSARAVSTLLSGPAAGPVASAQPVRSMGLPKAITVDMGGTSFEASLAFEGETSLRPGGTIDGLAISVPMLDIATLGAGGGSIASITPGGMLSVGPRSAGARPGPACYGRGGTEPTVTDASLLLGYLDPDGLASSGVRLSIDLAEQAINALTTPLGISTLEAAAGIHAVVHAAMADRLRLMTVGRGHDPREFALVAAGGAGPIHAAALARDLQIPLVIVPREAAVLCAAGMLASDFVHHDVRTVFGRHPPVDAAALERIFADMESRAGAQLRSEGVASEHIRFRRTAEVRYVRQVHQIELEFPRSAAVDDAALADRFHEHHEARFGHRLDGVPQEIVNVRLEARSVGGTAAQFDSAPGPVAVRPTARAHREAWFDGALLRSKVYNGEDLPAGAVLDGPALVETTGSTIVVPPGQRLSVGPGAAAYVLHSASRTLDAVTTMLRAGTVDA